MSLCCCAFALLILCVCGDASVMTSPYQEWHLHILFSIICPTPSLMMLPLSFIPVTRQKLSHVTSLTLCSMFTGRRHFVPSCHCYSGSQDSQAALIVSQKLLQPGSDRRHLTSHPCYFRLFLIYLINRCLSSPLQKSIMAAVSLATWRAWVVVGLSTSCKHRAVCLQIA